ncbi:MAG TPA: hypothetical protein VFV73_35515 [Streptosporangiaceae bacterium]|nr:hypothetical protein [Streptosporangiaceae bacterium]
MPAAEADIRTGHAASYLARLCGHAAKMGQASHRLPHRPRAHGRDGSPPEVRRVNWQAATAEARTTDGPEDHQAERARLPAQLPADRIAPDGRDEGSGG